MVNDPRAVDVGAYAVAFLDVLGTAKRIEKLESLTLEKEIKPGTKDHELLMESVLPVVTYRELLDRYIEGFRHSPGFESLQPQQREKMKAVRQSCIQNYGFADSLYMVAPLANNDDWYTPSTGMFTVLYGSCLAMAISLSQKCPLRGGIDVGKGVTLSGKENFSNALVRALKLERDIASHPRIVVGDDMFKLLDNISHQGHTAGDGKRAADTAREAMRLISKDDTDGRYIVDYLGEGLRDHMAPGYFTDVVDPARNFVLLEHARFLKERDCKLAPRYGEVERYFEKRLHLWR